MRTRFVVWGLRTDAGEAMGIAAATYVVRPFMDTGKGVAVDQHALASTACAAAMSSGLVACGCLEMLLTRRSSRSLGGARASSRARPR